MQLDATPASLLEALVRLGCCVVELARLLSTGRLHQPRAQKGRSLSFADGTTAAVYRETVVDRPPPADPAVLLVAFRLRGVRRGWGHALFRLESVLNTALFAGFPGFVSKLWLRHDEHGVYRGLYEWDGAARAAAYVAALRRVLGLVTATGSVHDVILPGARLSEVLEQAGSLSAGEDPFPGAWWQLRADAPRGG